MGRREGKEGREEGRKGGRKEGRGTWEDGNSDNREMTKLTKRK